MNGSIFYTLSKEVHIPAPLNQEILFHVSAFKPRSKRRWWRLRSYLMIYCIYGPVGVHCLDTITDVNDQHALNSRASFLFQSHLHPLPCISEARQFRGKLHPDASRELVTILSLSWQSSRSQAGYRSSVSKPI